jgi:hypothetical protein
MAHGRFSVGYPRSDQSAAMTFNVGFAFFFAICPSQLSCQ